MKYSSSALLPCEGPSDAVGPSTLYSSRSALILSLFDVHFAESVGLKPIWASPPPPPPTRADRHISGGQGSTHLPANCLMLAVLRCTFSERVRFIIWNPRFWKPMYWKSLLLGKIYKFGSFKVPFCYSVGYPIGLCHKSQLNDTK